MKKNKGITMVALVITIVLLLILAGITIDTGSDVIKKSELENIKTNMLLIKVKGKEYVENANFKLGTNIEKVTEEEKNKRIETAKSELESELECEEITNNMSEYESIIEKENSEFVYYYKLSAKNLIDMGITNAESDEDNGWFIIKYDIQNVTVEVYNTKGFENEDTRYYSLNELQNMDI